MSRFGVTEKDMPPGAVIRAGKKAGFRSFRVYPHQKHLLPLLYRQETGTWGRRLIQSTPFLNQLGLLFVTTVYKHFNGIVVMMK
jgi:hypothetical protein